MYASLGGDPDRAARAWRSAVGLGEPWVDFDPAVVWHQWEANAETADREEPPPFENPPSPQSLKELYFSLAYARLRLGNDVEATDLLDREAQLRAAAPGAPWHHFYASTDGLQADLAVMVRELASAAPDRRVLDRAVARRLKRAAPYNLCEVLDLQRAFPEVMPEIFPPEDLLSLLAPKGRKELGLPLDSGIKARR